MAGAASASREAPARTDRSGSGGWSAQVLPADRAGLEAYASFCEGALHAPAQGPLWAEAWLHDAGEDGVIVLLFHADLPVLALALEVVGKGPLRLARFAGGSHANGNFAPFHRDALPAEGSREAADALLDSLRRARPDIDMLALERQLETLAGVPNPLLALPHAPSPNIALAADLSCGFEQVLERGSSRRRKKHRAQCRKLEAAGGHRRFAARSPDEAAEILDLFFTLKGERLKRMGVADIFGAPRVRASFHRLFRAALDEPGQPFVLHALEVQGKIRAITGSSRAGDRIICEFGAFAEDELAKLAPGDFLSYENIAEACAEGFALYDFGVGDEPYKRAWCNIEVQHADVFVGLTGKGRLFAAVSGAVARAKRAVKASPALARTAMRVRRMIARS